MENEIREDVMEETTAIVPTVEEDVTPENHGASYNDAESTGSVGGFVKLAAIGVGVGLAVKKFIYDRKIKPAIEERREKKKAAEEAVEKERIRNMLTEFGVLVPTTTADPVPEEVAEEVNSEETAEETK